MLNKENYHTPFQTAIGLERKTLPRVARRVRHFIESIMPEPQSYPANLKRYQQAAIGFVVLNIVYLMLAYWKVPSFNITAQSVASLVFFTIFIGVLAALIYRGSRKLVVVLAAIYAARILFSSYTLVVGTAFPLVSYVLPTTVLIFYLLGRTVWNWP